MAKVTRPLFGSRATGPVGNAGTFRMGRHGPEFIAIAKGSGGATAEQVRRRACFKAAKAAHSAIVPTPYQASDGTRYRRIPDWPSFWRQWLIDHPECNA